MPLKALIGVAAGLFLFSFANTLWIRSALQYQGNSTTPVSRKFWDTLCIAFGHIHKQKILLFLIGYGMIANIMFGVIMACHPVMAVGIFGVSDQQYALINATAGLAAVVSLLSIPYLLKRFAITQVAVGATVVMFVGSFCAALAPSFWFYILAYALMIGGIMIFNVYTRTKRALIIPPEDLGKTVGIMVFFVQAALPLSGLLVALFSQSLGIRYLLLGVTIFAFIVVLALAITLRLSVTKSSTEG
jgi:predicted MFS family arabinose efflux permease